VGARHGEFAIRESGDLWRLLSTITLRKLYRQAARHSAGTRDIRREAAADLAADSLGRATAREPTPDEAAAVADELETLLSSVEPESRRIVELRLQGETIEEIARLLGRSERTVRRALQRIQDDYAQRHGMPGIAPRPAAIETRERQRPAMRPAVSETIDAPLQYNAFLLREMIGAGGMGKVYRAVRRRDEQPLALKFLRKNWLADPRAVAAFVREARTIADLRHPGIVALHGLGRTPWGGLFIAMDLVDGGDLSRQLGNGPVPAPRAAEWIAQAARALDCAHGDGVLHCDLKPANLLLAADDTIRLSDFGLARHINDRATGGYVAGTAAYMAPEQVADCWGPLTPATDVYGLGAVLYHLLTGRPPFAESRVPEMLARIVSREMPIAPQTLNARVPSRMSDLCVRCLSKSAADRFPSMIDLERELRE
jgi:predicted transcriptional regulator